MMEHRGAGGSFISSVGKRWTRFYPNRADRGESGKNETPEHQGRKGKSTKALPVPRGKAFPKQGWGAEALWDEGTRFPRGFWYRWCKEESFAGGSWVLNAPSHPEHLCRWFDPLGEKWEAIRRVGRADQERQP